MTIATGGQAAGEASDTSSAADRNCASFHERFRAAARLSFGPLTLLLEQTDGEQRLGETLQSTVWTAGCALADAMQAGLVSCAGASVLGGLYHRSVTQCKNRLSFLPLLFVL